MGTNENSLRTTLLSRTWIATTYFGEGFPYSIVRYLSTIFFKESGASLQAIGLTSLFGLPWVFKFLWAPFVDEFSTKRNWLLVMEFCLTLAIIFMAVSSTLPQALQVVSVLFLLTAVLSATHDISIDGFYLEALNRSDQAKFVGFQAMSYRLAMITVDGGILWIYGHTSWVFAFSLAAVIIGALLVFHYFRLPRIETPRQSGSALFRLLFRKSSLLLIAACVFIAYLGNLLWTSSWMEMPRNAIIPVVDKLGIPGLITLFLLIILIFLALNVRRLKRKLYASQSFYALAFVDYLDQPKIGIILAFLVFYRTGESFLLNMRYPFFRDIGISPDEFALVCGTFGIIAAISGGLLGGWLISRFGLKKMIWPMVLSQNILNLFYMILASLYNHVLVERALLHYRISEDISRFFSGVSMDLSSSADALQTLPFFSADLSIVTILVVLEALGAGLGTAAFMVFIMRTCKPKYKAANMSIATGIMNISATLAGVFSGFLATWLGFTWFFGFTFLATIPGMMMIFFLPYLDGSTASDHPSDTRSTS